VGTHEKPIAFARDALDRLWQQAGAGMPERDVAHELSIEAGYDLVTHGTAAMTTAWWPGGKEGGA
jgi:hypothetical protein